MKAGLGLVAAALVFATSASAQHPRPYAGEQSRSIKALSEDEVKQYLTGGGLGYAKTAELNRHPGPMHVLELAEKLQLTADQRAKTEALMATHKAEARTLGRKFVEAEQALDQLFASGAASQGDLARRVAAAASAQGDYRLSHLETHRRMRAILTAEQVAEYDRLRGYAATSGQGGHKQH
jgi:Spy/CpxP family protein refolding chaperone